MEGRVIHSTILLKVAAGFLEGYVVSTIRSIL